MRSDRSEASQAAKKIERVSPDSPPRGRFVSSYANGSHLLACGLALVLTIGDPAMAQDPAAADEPVSEMSGEPVPETNETSEEGKRLEERVRVVGSADQARESTGSEHFIDKEELERHEYTDIHRAIRRVPGVYLQDEEGYGLRPNIGIRGTGVERSQKVTLMEDGVLIAPAPYAAPSAYYFPTAGRMESLEVSKGPASIRQGPNTTGGVLNMVSRSVPTGLTGVGELAAGNDANLRGKFSVGNSSERFGWMAETFQQRTDGFKRLDDGGNTGFELQDYGVKLRANSREGARRYQSLELKLGKTDQAGDETYLGLTQDDFEISPFRRYAASGADVIDTEHEQVQLRHFLVARPNLDVTTTLYNNDFFRNWHKLESLDDPLDPNATVSISTLLADPDSPDHAGLMDVVRGDLDSAPGALNVRNNRRDYYSRGIQSAIGLRVASGAVKHAIEAGVRYHEDGEDRFQEEDQYQMGGGSMQLNALGDPGSQANRIASAEALALFVRDRMTFGKWRVEPGLRFESIDFERRDFGSSDPGRTGADLVVDRNDVDEIIPGVGVAYNVTERLGVFGGVHRGFAPPGPGKDELTRPEQSVNYELGVRVGLATQIQAVAFYTDYSNLLGADTNSSGGGGSGDQFNGGEAEVFGLEVSLDRDLARGGQAYSVPFQLAYTYTQGEFGSSFDSDFPDWGDVTKGDRLPYLPEHQLFAELGWRRGRWATWLAGNYVGEIRTVAGQGPIPEEESIEDRLVFDVSGSMTFRRHYRVFLQVRNVTDETYVVARRPAGLRPGLPRTVLVGLGFDF